MCAFTRVKKSVDHNRIDPYSIVHNLIKAGCANTKKSFCLLNIEETQPKKGKVSKKNSVYKGYKDFKKWKVRKEKLFDLPGVSQGLKKGEILETCQELTLAFLI